jgi:hypothetical protein
MCERPAPKTEAELEAAIRDIVDFIISDARMHDSLDELSDEQTGGLVELFRLARATLPSPH